MTALCPGGGTSSPQPGHAAVVQYSTGLIASIFAAYDLVWLIPIIPLLSFGNQVLAAFCAVDPPAIPAFTLAEVNALLYVQLGGDYFSGLGKMTDLCLNLIWHDACKCDSGTATPPVPPTPPAGTPITQPPVPGTVGPCRTNTLTNAFCFGSGSGTSAPWPYIDASNGASMASTLNQSVSAVRVIQKNIVCTGAGATFNGFISWQDAALGTLRNDSFSTAPGATTVFDAIPPLNATQFVIGYNQAGTGTSRMDGSVLERYCGGARPGAPQTACCPPDVSTQAYLDNILKLVTLIQRQSAPFAYVYGTNHVALTGHGSIAVAGLIGVSVDITTIPPSIGRADGTPIQYFDLGYVTLGTADGSETSRRLDHEGTLLIPPQAGVFTTIGYTLPPGVVVSIRELVREP